MLSAVLKALTVIFPSFCPTRRSVVQNEEISRAIDSGDCREIVNGRDNRQSWWLRLSQRAGCPSVGGKMRLARQHGGRRKVGLKATFEL